MGPEQTDQLATAPGASLSINVTPWDPKRPDGTVMEGWSSAVVRCEHGALQVNTSPEWGDGVTTALLNLAIDEGCSCAMPKLQELLGDDVDAEIERFRQMRQRRLYAGPGGRVTAVRPVTGEQGEALEAECSSILDHLDRPHAETILALAGAAAHLLTDAEAACIVEREDMALQVFLTNARMEDEIDGVLAHPELGWDGLSPVRRRAGLYAAAAFAADLTASKFEDFHRGISPGVRSAWAVGLVPELAQS